MQTWEKHETWSQAADFETAADNLIATLARNFHVVSAGDMDAIKAEAKSMDDACDGCHKMFRVPEPPK